MAGINRRKSFVTASDLNTALATVELSKIMPCALIGDFRQAHIKLEKRRRTAVKTLRGSRVTTTGCTFITATIGVCMMHFFSFHSDYTFPCVDPT
jgi:hypothetical protein